MLFGTADEVKEATAWKAIVIEIVRNFHYLQKQFSFFTQMKHLNRKITS